MPDEKSYKDILIRSEGNVGIVQLNRPKVLNALNREIMSEVSDALEAFDNSNEIGCIVLTGNERAFAAGADIDRMADATPFSMQENSFIDYWDRLEKIGKPVIAAVSGYALGGGCELAMACDLIVASESASFGQPEINLGVIPGAGGTQRLGSPALWPCQPGGSGGIVPGGGCEIGRGDSGPGACGHSPGQRGRQCRL
jgi:enoyl-CoA hydratase